MANVYDGKYLWIWELDHTLGGDLQKIAALGHSLGITGWVIKAHDGATVWPQFAQAFGTLKSAGFDVAAWGYVYGTDPSGEAKAAQSAMQVGASWYVFDAEDSYAGKTIQAEQFGTLLKQQAGHVVIGYSSYAFPNEHALVPYKQFSAFCDVVLPQIYWADFAMNVDTAVTTSFSQLKPFGLPIAPIGQAYGAATAPDIESFALKAEQLGASSISFWDAQSASSSQLRAISLAKSPVLISQHSGLEPSDVVKGDWFYGAVMDLLDKKIITAYPDGKFLPNDPITRAQAADWLHRLRINVLQSVSNVPLKN